MVGLLEVVGWSSRLSGVGVWLATDARGFVWAWLGWVRAEQFDQSLPLKWSACSMVTLAQNPRKTHVPPREAPLRSLYVAAILLSLCCTVRYEPPQ